MGVHDVAVRRSPDGADAVLIGSGIRAGRRHKSALQWVATHQEALRRLPVATFSSSREPVAGVPDVLAKVDGYTTYALEPLGLAPMAYRSFSGGYDLDRVSRPGRLIMKVMRQSKACDYLDEAAVRRWTAEVLPQLEADSRA